MSVDAVTYIIAEFLTSTFGFVVNIGETITGKEFSSRILSVSGRSPIIKFAANDASRNIVSITRTCGDSYDIKWRKSK